MRMELPSKPPMPSNMNDERAMTKYQEDMQSYNRILAMITQMNAEEAATKSNMDKARHDAMMAIINNIKA